MTDHNVVSSIDGAAAETGDGTHTLADPFEGRSQLLVYHRRHDEYGTPDAADAVATNVGPTL